MEDPVSSRSLFAFQSFLYCFEYQNFKCFHRVLYNRISRVLTMLLTVQLIGFSQYVLNHRMSYVLSVLYVRISRELWLNINITLVAGVISPEYIFLVVEKVASETTTELVPRFHFFWVLLSYYSQLDMWHLMTNEYCVLPSVVTSMVSCWPGGHKFDYALGWNWNKKHKISFTWLKVDPSWIGYQENGPRKVWWLTWYWPHDPANAN